MLIDQAQGDLRITSAFALLPEKCAGEACSGLRVGLAVDACQVALHHAQRNPQVIGYLLERALVGGYGAQHFFLARGQAASADELGLHLLKCRRGYLLFHP